MFTKKQIAAVKYLIFMDKTATNLVKQILAFLLDQSEGLTKEVRFNLSPTDWEYAEISSHSHSMHDMQHSAHLHAVMVATGSKLTFSHSQFREKNSEPWSFGIWLAEDSCSSKAEVLLVSRAELEEINTKRSGLYKDLEANDDRLGLDTIL